LCSLREKEEKGGRVIKLIDALAKSKELEIFEADIVVDFIDFKWDRFAAKVHKIGCLFHILYIVALFAFIGAAYSGDDVFEAIPLQIYYLILGSCLVYPAIYDGVQLWNYLDLLHIVGGYANLYLQ
jgi:hypothetical protein